MLYWWFEKKWKRFFEMLNDEIEITEEFLENSDIIEDAREIDNLINNFKEKYWFYK